MRSSREYVARAVAVGSDYAPRTVMGAGPTRKVAVRFLQWAAADNGLTVLESSVQVREVVR